MDHRATVVLLVLLMALAYVAGDPCVCDGSFGTSPWENKVSQTRAENGKPFIDAKVFPLHNATAKWDMRGMKAAIAKGANVNQRATEDGLTPLQIALLTNSLDTWHPYTEEVYQAVKILLDAKADPNIPYSPEAHRMHDVSPAPLHYAAEGGRVDLVTMMLRAGANPNARDSYHYNETALHKAAQCDRSRSWGPRAAATVKVLLAWGADPTARANGQTPFEMTPNHPTCKPLPKDHRFTIQDCQEVCKVLRDGLPAAEKAAIKAGKLLDDGSRDLPKCCANRTSTNITLTQCCF